MFDDAVCERSPDPLRLKNEIVCGWIKSTGAEFRSRGKFAAKLLRLEREIRSAFGERPKNSPTDGGRGRRCRVAGQQPRGLSRYIGDE
jgi:hypothetical protein